jgi:hypothetical protein
VKSVSLLWAVAPAEVARLLQQAHQKVVGNAMVYVEQEVLLTREGTMAARQLDCPAWRSCIARTRPITECRSRPAPHISCRTLVAQHPTEHTARPAQFAGFTSYSDQGAGSAGALDCGRRQGAVLVQPQPSI